MHVPYPYKVQEIAQEITTYNKIRLGNDFFSEDKV